MRTCAVPARCPFSPTQQYRGSMMPAGNDVIRPRRGSTFTLGLASQSRSFLRFALGSSGRRTSSFHSPACGSGEEKKKQSFPPIDASTLAHVPLRGFFLLLGFSRYILPILVQNGWRDYMGGTGNFLITIRCFENTYNW